MRTFEVTFPDDAIRAAYLKVGANADAAVKEASVRIGGKVLRRFLDGRFRTYDGTKGRTIARRSSNLFRSFTSTTNPDGSVSIASIGVKYAAIHETGGTIKPKKGKYLTIPLRAALEPTGSTRATAKLEKQGGKWVTAGRVPGATGRETFIRRTPSGTPVIFVEGKGGDLLPLYILRKESKIPAKLGFFSTWALSEDIREREYDRALNRVGDEFAQDIQREASQ